MKDTALFSRARELVSGDFRNLPEVAKVCFSIIDFIQTEPDEQLQHLTFGTVAKVSGTSREDVVSRAVAYLCGDIVQLLEMRFEFIDGDEIYQLDPAEVGLARRENLFVHPDTGMPVEDFEKQIYIYFAPKWVPQDFGDL